MLITLPVMYDSFTGGTSRHPAARSDFTQPARREYSVPVYYQYLTPGFQGSLPRQ